jgi:hypothetical protein
VTYNLANDGSIYSQGDNLTIQGTFAADLDNGLQTLTALDEDFFWAQDSPTIRNIEPQNTAAFAVYP